MKERAELQSLEDKFTNHPCFEDLYDDFFAPLVFICFRDLDSKSESFEESYEREDNSVEQAKSEFRQFLVMMEEDFIIKLFSNLVLVQSVLLNEQQYQQAKGELATSRKLHNLVEW